VCMRVCVRVASVPSCAHAYARNRAFFEFGHAKSPLYSTTVLVFVAPVCAAAPASTSATGTACSAALGAVDSSKPALMCGCVCVLRVCMCVYVCV